MRNVTDAADDVDTPSAPGHKGATNQQSEERKGSRAAIHVGIGEAEFLTHVAKGEQGQAEEMLKKNRHLALASGTVTDHADRTFNNITGFQYAVWALDWHIKKYLPEEASRSQAQGFITGLWVEQHGVVANWQNLLDAYAYYLDNYERLFKASKWTELNNIWLLQIGGSQKLLPMHVFHEYCHPDRPFDPVPDFTFGSLPRSLPKWLSLDMIGSAYSIYRTAAIRPKMWRDNMHKPVVKAMYHYTCDRNALIHLARTRSQQREQLVAELTPGACFRMRSRRTTRMDGRT